MILLIVITTFQKMVLSVPLATSMLPFVVSPMMFVMLVMLVVLVVKPYEFFE